jgi:hypothetical protein
MTLIKAINIISNFLCNLFNDLFSVTQTTASNEGVISEW